MSKAVRFGIIGAGRIAQQFARDIQFAKEAELTAVASRDRARATEFAKQHSIKNSFSNYQSLVDSREIDVVYIATPHSHHLEQAELAMQAGKAVMCEKPVTLNSGECKQFIALAKQHDVYAMEAMWTHFLPAVVKAKEWVDAGLIGEIRQLKADFGYPLLPYRADLREYNSELGGGCMLEMGVYPTAIAWYFLKDHVKENHTQSLEAFARYAPNGVEDDLSWMVEYGDITATLGSSFRSKLKNYCWIIGDKGIIEIPDFWRATECKRYKLDTCVEEFSQDHKGDGFEYQIAAVCNDIKAGKKESSVVPLANSLAFQQHMEKTLTAGKRRREYRTDSLSSELEAAYP